MVNTPLMYTVPEMVQLLEKEGIKVKIRGSGSVKLTHLKNLGNADRNSLSFYVGEDNSKLMHLKQCALVCMPSVMPWCNSVTLIQTEDPRLAFYILAQQFTPIRLKPSIHPTAMIDTEATIHPTVTIGPFCVLEKCAIAKETILHSHVTVYKNTKIASRVEIESGSRIGATGQVWAWGVDGKKWILPQLGGTVIEDDCFIGTNVSIVRGAIQDTIISKGCRIAHGSRIGHNCYIGEETFVSNGVTIPGSVSIGKYCFLGAGSVFRPGVELGENIIVGAGSVVIKNFLETGAVLAGNPAKIIKNAKKSRSLTGIPKMHS